MATKFKTLRDFFYSEGRQVNILIPKYQRGYKWGVKPSPTQESSAEHLVRSFLMAWKNRIDEGGAYFLQGITVTESGDAVVLIDGQQRITTIYLILRSLGVEYITGTRNIDLRYEVRQDSQDFLTQLRNPDFAWRDASSEHSQDIHYFKEALKQIEKIESELFNIKPEEFASNKEMIDDFVDFMMRQVRFLYIIVDKAQAVNTFTMMNGHKATMRGEELIKAEMLHKASMTVPVEIEDRPATFDEVVEGMKDFVAIEWKLDSLRSRYAREWDRWLYWWNRRDVREFFKSGKDPLGYLLKYYHWDKAGGNPVAKFDFATFKRDHLLEKVQTAQTFKELRDLEKRFEDAYNSPIVHNYLKLALITATGGDNDKFEIFKYFFSPDCGDSERKYYAEARLVNATHRAITGCDTRDDEQSRSPVECAKDVYEHLKENKVYGKYDEDAFRQLLRLNVEEYNKLNGGLGASFDFSIWSHRSLEHIFPKSKFYHVEQRDGADVYVRGDGVVVTKKDIVSEKLVSSEEYFKHDGGEHCIGNLVLLYKDDNSSFGAAEFEEKKRKFFDLNPDKEELKFASRNLLHSIAAFAESSWDADAIRKYRDLFLARFAKDYFLDVEVEK